MKCWSCKQLINHKKVKWKPRKIDFSTHPDEELRRHWKEMHELMGENPKKKLVASPNSIFGYKEYEYMGSCPLCKSQLNLLWFGLDSVKKFKGFTISEEPFLCAKCEFPIHREFQVWYSFRWVKKGETIEQAKEFLVSICPTCHDEIIYPDEYDLETGIIK